MYEDFYRLSGSPFQLTPDSRFFFESRVHARAIAHLTFGLAQGEGFVVITGEVGAGKTTLVERLWSSWTATPSRWSASTPRRSPATTCSAWRWPGSAWTARLPTRRR